MSKPDSQLFLKDKTCKYERMYMLLGFEKNFFLHFYHTKEARRLKTRKFHLKLQIE